MPSTLSSSHHRHSSAKRLCKRRLACLLALGPTAGCAQAPIRLDVSPTRGPTIHAAVGPLTVSGALGRGGLGIGVTSGASIPRSHKETVPASVASASAAQVLATADRYVGTRYRYGGETGPHAFDCSGFVQYVYRHALGRHLPKYTDTQYRVLRHIHRHALRRGDLVFVGNRHHHKSHVGIYAGHGTWWEAPHTGSHVRKRHVWGRVHSYARVIRR